MYQTKWVGVKLNKGSWLSIIEYADFRNISIAGARSFIKTGRVKSKLSEGKYYILVNDDDFKEYSKEREKKDMAIKLELDNLRKEISELNVKNKELQNIIHHFKIKKNVINLTIQ